MILPITSINTNIPQQINKNKKFTTASANSNVQETMLSGIPKAYISFGTNQESKISDEEIRRRQQIAKYLQYKNWNKHEDYNAKAEKEIESLKNLKSWTILGHKFDGIVRASDRKKIHEKHRLEYIKKAAEYDEIMANEDYYKSLIKTEDIKVYERIKELLKSKPNAINSKIAGYEKEKDIVQKMLVEPIQRETALGTTEKIPPAVLLYGPIRCGKTELAKAIAEETGCNVDVMGGVNVRIFADELADKVNNAKKHYKTTSEYNSSIAKEPIATDENFNVESKAQRLVNLKSPRTIVVIDEVDKYFDPAFKENEFDNPQDIEQIIENNKTILKGLLDHCSECPSGEYSSDAAGLSFIFTTNYPTLVDSEISLRKGKCNRIPIFTPNVDDIKKIMKFYLTKENQRIQQEIDNGRDLSLVDINSIPFDSYDKLIKPSKLYGALTGAGVENAVKATIDRYLKNSDETVNMILPRMLKSPKFRITPQKLDQFINEMERFGHLDKDIDEAEELELLKIAEKLGMLSEKLHERLKTLNELHQHSSNDSY